MCYKITYKKNPLACVKSVKMDFFKKTFNQKKPYGYQQLENENSGCCSTCSCGCEAGQSAVRENQRQEDKAEEAKMKKDFEEQQQKDLKQQKLDQQEADKKFQDQAREKRLMRFDN